MKDKDQNLIWEAWSSQGYSGEPGSLMQGTPGNPGPSQLFNAGADGFSLGRPANKNNELIAALKNGKHVEVTLTGASNRADELGPDQLELIELEYDGKFLYGTDPKTNAPVELEFPTGNVSVDEIRYLDN